MGKVSEITLRSERARERDLQMFVNTCLTTIEAKDVSDTINHGWTHLV